MAFSNRKEELLDIIFPSQCLGCGSHGNVLCRRCLASLAGGSLSEAGASGHWRRSVVSGYRAAGVYGGLIKEMVLNLKSSARPFAGPLSRLMVAAAGNDPDYLAPDFVCFVPSERKKIVERGYNPAELLARGVSRDLGRPLGRVLRKTRSTLDQDRVGAEARWENVAGAFAVTSEGGVRGRILLVDDVLTTGATAEACSQALLDAGAEAVHVLVAARAMLQRGRSPA